MEQKDIDFLSFSQLNFLPAPRAAPSPSWSAASSWTVEVVCSESLPTHPQDRPLALECPLCMLEAGRFRLKSVRAQGHPRADSESSELYKSGQDSRTGLVTAVTTAEHTHLPLPLSPGLLCSVLNGALESFTCYTGSVQVHLWNIIFIYPCSPKTKHWLGGGSHASLLYALQ